MLENRMLEEGIPGGRAGAGDLTRLHSGVLRAERLLALCGAEGEQRLLRQSPSGRMGPQAFAELVADLKANGLREPVSVHLEQDGRAHIQEGNHRLRAAHLAGIAVALKVKYFGNAQRDGRLLAVAR
jgi:hypothetical protein